MVMELLKGDLREFPVEGSTGDVLLVVEEDLDRVPGGCGRYPRLKWPSTRDDGGILASYRLCSSMRNVV